MPLPDFFLIGASERGRPRCSRRCVSIPTFSCPRSRSRSSLSEQEVAALDLRMRHDLRRWKFTGRISDPHEYLRLFSTAAAHQVVGEASTGYLASRTAAMRINKSLPEAKIIAVLRHPVERAHAQYWFDVMWDFERAPTFEQSLARESAGSGVCLPLGISATVSTTPICRSTTSCSGHIRSASTSTRTGAIRHWRCSPTCGRSSA